MYRLFVTNNFKRKRKKLSKEPNTKDAIEKCLNQLKIDPFYNSLKTHKADAKYAGKTYSSWVLGDLRVFWNFNDNEIDVIDLFDLDNHYSYK